MVVSWAPSVAPRVLGPGTRRPPGREVQGEPAVPACPDPGSAARPTGPGELPAAQALQGDSRAWLTQRLTLHTQNQEEAGGGEGVPPEPARALPPVPTSQWLCVSVEPSNGDSHTLWPLSCLPSLRPGPWPLRTQSRWPVTPISPPYARCPSPSPSSPPDLT